jgi:hypothetical protein
LFFLAAIFFPGPFGTWGAQQACHANQFVTKFSTKAESKSWLGDDMAMTGITLWCNDNQMLASPSLDFGTTGSVKDCPDGYIGAKTLIEPQVKKD